MTAMLLDLLRAARGAGVLGLLAALQPDVQVSAAAAAAKRLEPAGAGDVEAGVLAVGFAKRAHRELHRCNTLLGHVSLDEWQVA